MIQTLEQPSSRIGFARTVGYLAVASIAATILAGIVSLLFIFVAIFPMSLAGMFFMSAFLQGLWKSAVQISPVTFLLLPAIAIVCLPHRLILRIAAPVVGLVGGVTAMVFWSSMRETAPRFLDFTKTYLSFEPQPINLLGAGVGAAAGFSAGLVFAIAIPKVSR